MTDKAHEPFDPTDTNDPTTTRPEIRPILSMRLTSRPPKRSPIQLTTTTRSVQGGRRKSILGGRVVGRLIQRGGPRKSLL
jgi:hypothetical protein